MDAIELVVDARADVGEGPCWDESTGTLLFVDITPGRVVRHDPATGALTSFELGQEVGAVIPRTQGGLVVAARDGIGVVDAGGEAFEIVTPIEADVPANRMNDAKCDPAGRLWAGTMAFDFSAGAGALYRVETNFEHECVVPEVTISNGLAWSLDGARMYYIDSPRRGVDVFDYSTADGRASNRRRLVSFDDAHGLPDGMTVDAEDHLWIAFFLGGAVRRYTPAGELEREIELPVSQVTSCCFGGDDYTDLYITSARQGLAAEQLSAQPHAGGTFRCRPGVAGVAPTYFAG